MCPLRTSWKYFPNRRGLISGLLFGCFGVSSMFFDFLAAYYINPTGKETVDGFYDKDIALKVRLLF